LEDREGERSIILRRNFVWDVGVLCGSRNCRIHLVTGFASTSILAYIGLNFGNALKSQLKLFINAVCRCNTYW